MKKFLFISVLILITVGYSFLSCRHVSIVPEKAIAGDLLIQVDSFTESCKALQFATDSGSGNEKRLQQLFLQARLAYKRFEWAAEYFVPSTSRAVNGPPTQEVELSGQVFEPAGLQIIESFLFPRYDTSNKKLLLRQLAMLQPDCDKYRSYFANIGIFDWQVFDAAKLEVFRVITLGIVGFDNPVTLKSSMESAAALGSLQKVLSYYGDGADKDDMSAKINASVDYLNKNDDFNSFNRMNFIIKYSNPLTIAISDLEKKLNIHVIRYNRLLNQDAKTLFDSNAFNVNAYAPDVSSFISEEKVTLGKALFEDPILSGNGKRSCRSCHQPDKAFTDGMVKNTIIDNNLLLARNTPTLINAALQPSLFYDLRVNSLEEQSHSVVQSNNEMHGDMGVSVKKLWQDKKYRQMFLAAFPLEAKNGIDTFEIMNSIGSYIRSLTYLNSRFDEYMRGDHTSLNADEINGFNLFMGKAKCATCHYMPLFNGTFPPRFTKIDAEVIGVPVAIGSKEIDTDLGRYAIIQVESFKHAFKTPTLRNAALTPPYMHNGVFNTLEQVMDFYNKGGGRGLGTKVDNQTLPFDKLDLSEKETSDIIAFIKSLNSKLPLK